MSDCCGDYYVETTVKGATLTEVEGAVRHLMKPEEKLDKVEQQGDGVYVTIYEAGHDQYISDACELKDDLQSALDDLIEQLEDKPISYDEIALWIYKYEWVEI